jgi:hypothetical protein
MIISGADDNPKFQDMLSYCERHASSYYPFTKFDFTSRRPNLEKVSAMITTLEDNPWVLWMDADSMLFQPIPEVIVGDHDIAFCTKHSDTQSDKYGSLYYSGFVFARQTEAAMDFLHAWEAILPGNTSDQQALHGVMKQNHEASIKLLDPHIYVAVAPIFGRRLPKETEKVIHFKGALQKKWAAYRDGVL